MARLFDKIKSLTKNKTILEEMVCIDASNVAEYFYEVSSQETWTTKDFPNIAPPFNIFCIEYNLPKMVNCNGKLLEARWMSKKQAVIFEALPREETPEKYTKLLPVNSKWIVVCIICHEYNKDEGPIPLAKIVYGVTQEGLWALGENNKDVCLFQPYENNYFGFTPEIQDEIRGLLNPCLLAISFMHCKNTTVSENKPPEKVQLKRKKNNKPPLTQYYTLDIEPMKKVLKTEGGINGGGLKRALHICRGHFKDYSNGKGLFGKYKGLYWWDSTVRGTKETGEIVKDYNIKV
jgi:hypothetical protein